MTSSKHFMIDIADHRGGYVKDWPVQASFHSPLPPFFFDSVRSDTISPQSSWLERVMTI